MTIRTLPSILLFTLMLFVTNCGGQTPQLPQDGGPAPRPTPTPTTLTAAQVFSTSMIGQTWTFVNGYGDHTFIAVESAPFCVFDVCDGKSVTWHFTKDNARAYWNPGVPSELWFYLHLESNGSWRALGFESIQNGVSQSAWYSLIPGWTGVPYTIIPASSISPAVNTAYQGNLENGLTTNTTPTPISTWGSTWTTFASADSVTTPLTGTVRGLTSKQCEGGTSGACDYIVETWHFCPGMGLCAITPTYGLNGPLDPRLAIVRTH